MKIIMKLTYGRTMIEHIIYCDPPKEELNRIIMNTMKAFQQLRDSKTSEARLNESK